MCESNLLQVWRNKDAEGWEFKYDFTYQWSNVVYTGSGYPRRPVNVWGAVKRRSENGEMLNVICDHGGSEWLCESCARTLQAEVEFTRNVETGIERHFREQEEANV
jgi:hypothetical protein